VTIPPSPVEARQLRTANGPAGLRRDELAVIELLRQRGRAEPLKAAADGAAEQAQETVVEPLAAPANSRRSA
jgi:hypothetical protein